MKTSLSVAVQYLKDKGFSFVGIGEGKHRTSQDCDYIISDTFEPLKP
jgi:hypothetical protein